MIKNLANLMYQIWNNIIILMVKIVGFIVTSQYILTSSNVTLSRDFLFCVCAFSIIVSISLDVIKFI